MEKYILFLNFGQKKFPFIKFKLINILTRAESDWKGRTGAIDNQSLNELIEPSNLKKPYFCICGPKGFTDKTIGYFYLFK